MSHFFFLFFGLTLFIVVAYNGIQLGSGDKQAYVLGAMSYTRYMRGISVQHFQYWCSALVGAPVRVFVIINYHHLLLWIVLSGLQMLCICPENPVCEPKWAGHIFRYVV